MEQKMRKKTTIIIHHEKGNFSLEIQGVLYDYIQSIKSIIKYILELGRTATLFSSKYFPFSLFNRGYLSHYNNRKIAILYKQILLSFYKIKIKADIVKVEKGRLFITFECVLKNQTTQITLEDLKQEIITQTGSQDVYVRENKDRRNVLDVIIPVSKIDN